VLAILALVAPTLLFWSRLARLEEYQSALNAWEQSRSVYYQEVAAEAAQRDSSRRAAAEILTRLDGIERAIAEDCRKD